MLPTTAAAIQRSDTVNYQKQQHPQQAVEIDNLPRALEALTAEEAETAKGGDFDLGSYYKGFNSCEQYYGIKGSSYEWQDLMEDLSP
jgi:hypothetical protein